MARIVMADDGIPFDGRTPLTQPLGGAESAFVSLACAFARRGHDVLALSNCAEALSHVDVQWAPIAHGAPDGADLYIANRGDKLLRLVPRARATAFWIHNPADYLLKWRYLWKLWRRRPSLVFLGAYHASTYPAWAPGGRRAVIPHAVDDVFRTVATPSAPPPPRAAFTSNPLRDLDWLLDLWVTRIRPAVPTAELHVFSHPVTYGPVGAAKADAMEAVLARARALARDGVVLRAPCAKPRLAEELAGFRAFLYRGTRDETFCFAAAEAQAAGVPAVVCDYGSVAERVRDGETGVVIPRADSAREAGEFAEAAVSILRHDATWKRLHQGALTHQRGRGWDVVAQEFEALIRGQ